MFYIIAHDPPPPPPPTLKATNRRQSLSLYTVLILSPFALEESHESSK
jgi:hypothetical protein